MTAPNWEELAHRGRDACEALAAYAAQSWRLNPEKRDRLPEVLTLVTAASCLVRDFDDLRPGNAHPDHWEEVVTTAKNRADAALLDHGPDCPTCPPDSEDRPSCPPVDLPEPPEGFGPCYRPSLHPLTDDQRAFLLALLGDTDCLEGCINDARHPDDRAPEGCCVRCSLEILTECD